MDNEFNDLMKKIDEALNEIEENLQLTIKNINSIREALKSE